MNLNEIGFQFIINLFNGNKSHIPNMGISFQNMLPSHQICRFFFLSYLSLRARLILLKELESKALAMGFSNRVFAI